MKKIPSKISDRHRVLPAVLTGRTQHLHIHNRRPLQDRHAGPPLSNILKNILLKINPPYSLPLDSFWHSLLTIIHGFLTFLSLKIFIHFESVCILQMMPMGIDCKDDKNKHTHTLAPLFLPDKLAGEETINY